MNIVLSSLLSIAIHLLSFLKYQYMLYPTLKKKKKKG